MKLNIMTWNCNIYREKISKLNWVRYNSIVNIIKGRLELENSIAVLQEIPYKTSETWELHPFFEQIKNDFPEDKYDRFFSISDENQIMMTVILSKKEILEDYSGVGSIINNNRIVCCKIQDVIIAGVHMPTSFRILRNDDEKTRLLKKWKESVWDNLIELAKANAKGDKELIRKLIILGDFNAFIGCKDQLTESKFIELHRYVNDIIPDDVPTYIGNTPIDHIFVNFNTQLKHKFQVEDSYDYSDHKYINAEFNF